MLEPIDIAEGRRLDADADPAPWHIIRRPGPTIVDDNGMGIAQPPSDNAALIVWARNNLPALLDRIESLEADLERAHFARAEAQNRASDLRKAADGWASHAEQTESALLEARATNARLNRRCQQAEKAARDNIDACKRAGMSFGRSLARYAALLYREDLERAQATIARVRTLLDDPGYAWIVEDDNFENTPEKVSVIEPAELLAALGGDQ